MTGIQLTIDELVIGGVTEREGRRIGQVVAFELEHLLAQRGVFEKQVQQEVLLAPVQGWHIGATPEQIGSTIAQAIYEALV